MSNEVENLNRTLYVKDSITNTTMIIPPQIEDEKPTDWIIVGNGGDYFEGSRDQFRDCFFDNAHNQIIIDWAINDLENTPVWINGIQYC